jgi:histidyl-tRNA synthetase
MILSLLSTRDVTAFIHNRRSFHVSLTSLTSIRESVVIGGGRVSAAVRQQGEEPKKKPPLGLLPPKGTRDFYPEDQRLKSWLFSVWRQTAAKYGFEEYDAPVVEHADLYVRKAGEEVTQQLYDFKDKSDRHLSLRPEMTPSLARMVLARRGSLVFPLKWFAIPQCWRYERMTRGRRRFVLSVDFFLLLFLLMLCWIFSEHYQWNMDVFGVQGIDAEAELLSAIVSSFNQMGLTAKDVGIKINSRHLLNDLMARVGESSLSLSLSLSNYCSCSCVIVCR